MMIPAKLPASAAAKSVVLRALHFVWPKRILGPINHYKWYHQCQGFANKTWNSDEKS